MAKRKTTTNSLQSKKISFGAFGFTIEASPVVVSSVAIGVVLGAVFWFHDEIAQRFRSLTAADHATYGTLPPGMSLTCRYTSGPQTGNTQDFYGISGARPGPIGAPCGDGIASTGTVVAPASAYETAFIRNEGEPDAKTSICQFTYGPKRGGWHDYAPMQGLLVGSACQDGDTSVGVTVTRPQGREY